MYGWWGDGSQHSLCFPRRHQEPLGVYIQRPVSASAVCNYYGWVKQVWFAISQTDHIKEDLVIFLSLISICISEDDIPGVRPPCHTLWTKTSQRSFKSRWLEGTDGVVIIWSVIAHKLPFLFCHTVELFQQLWKWEGDSHSRRGGRGPIHYAGQHRWANLINLGLFFNITTTDFFFLIDLAVWFLIWNNLLSDTGYR